MNKKLLSALLGTCFFISNSAFSSESVELIDASNPNQILELTKANFGRAILIPSEKEDPRIAVAKRDTNDVDFLIFFSGCDKNHANCTRLFFLKELKGVSISADKANEWNNKLVPYTVISSNPVILKTSFYLEKGVSKENFINSLVEWTAINITVPIMLSK